MNERLQAVVDALWLHGGNTGTTPKTVYLKPAKAALKDLDKVTFSDEAVNRAAKELPHDQLCGGEYPCDCWDSRKAVARAIIAALKGKA